MPILSYKLGSSRNKERKNNRLLLNLNIYLKMVFILNVMLNMDANFCRMNAEDNFDD